ncbi:hypothetical protein VNO77_02404 [Canavalia gladiata]|uniref:Uncharacterized protein n=1 Tax=Canavalia gladiata TaxID=3824 RepID=A0AAN9R641_CANGL
MKNRDEEEVNPPLSILKRLDRLESLLVFLEEKQHYSGTDAAVAVDGCLKPEERCKNLFSVLEEVHHKGTLLERVALLENRVLQLSIDMDLGNTSRSSSSTSAVVVEKLEHMNVVTTIQEKQDPLIAQDKIRVEACSLNSPSCMAQRRRIKVVSKKGNNKEWLKWFTLGC